MQLPETENFVPISALHFFGNTDYAKKEEKDSIK